ncbi:MAG: porin [Gammaproteobacteria bacterium]
MNRLQKRNMFYTVIGEAAMASRFIALIAVSALLVSITAQAEVEVKPFGFFQLTAESRDQDSPDDNFAFGADRIRFGFKIKDTDSVLGGTPFGGLQVDFNKSPLDKTVEGPNGKSVDLPAVIKDAYAGYKFNDAASIKMGQFKTPLGMDFNTSGKKLDITKRGLEKALVLERAVGVMLSGRKIGGGFGYDIGVFNPAGRGSASPVGDRGDNNSFAGRLMFDGEDVAGSGGKLHVEAAYGSDEAPSGAEDYDVWDVAGSFKRGIVTVKAEYISGSNVDGVDGDDQFAWYLHGGVMVHPKVEAVIRYYDTEFDPDVGSSTDLSNIYLGVNVFLGSNKTNGRLQVNYVLAGGDETDFEGVGKTFKDDAIVVQYQASF